MAYTCDLAQQFQEKVAVVTGGTQGVGEATARLFARRGAEGIVICGRNQKRGNHVARELSTLGCRTIFVEADLVSDKDCFRVIDVAEREFNRIDTLITRWLHGPRDDRRYNDRTLGSNVRS